MPQAPLSQTLTVRQRLVRSRGFAFFVLIAAGAAFMLVQAVTHAVSLSAAPELGLYEGSDTRVFWVDSSRWPGVQVGDGLVELAGQRLSGPKDFRETQLRLGVGPVTARFRRGATEWSLTSQARLWTGWELFFTALPLAVGCALALIGGIAYLMRPGERVSWAFFLFCLTLAYLCVSEWVLFYRHPWGGRLDLMALGLIGSLFMHLAVLFPRPLRFFVARPRRALGLYVPAFAIAVAAVGISRTSPWESVPQQAAVLFAGLACPAGVGLIVAQYVRDRRELDGPSRSTYRLLFAGATLGLVGPAALVVATNYTSLFDDLPNFREVISSGVLAFVVVLGYCLARHNPLSVDRFTAAVVGYTLTSALLGVGFVGLLLGLPLLLGRAGLSRSPELLVALTAGCFLGFMPLYRALKRRTDRWFDRAETGGAALAEKLAHLSLDVAQLDKHQGWTSVLGAATAFGAEGAQLWWLDDQARALRCVAADARSAHAEQLRLPASGALFAAVSARAGGLTGLVPQPFPEHAQAELRELLMVLALPVRTKHGCGGFLAVGRKRSGTAFRPDELAYLSAVAAQAAVVADRPDAAMVGRYRLDRRLGVGGMAEVFLAFQSGPAGIERKVALKVPLPQFREEPTSMAMFLDEARLAANLHHANIVQVYEVDRAADVYFMSMELVDGPSLRTLLSTLRTAGSPLAPRQAVSIATQVLEALSYAHSLCDEAGRPLRVVHRDVTPSNILLTKRGEVKLLDFGIARAATHVHATKAGLVRGTVPYMSPEQANGGSVTARSDLYSVGAVLYELLTLHRPYPEGRGLAGAAPASALAPSVPPALSAHLERALSAEAEARFADADGMREALISALHPELPSTRVELAEWLAQATPEPLDGPRKARELDVTRRLEP